MDQRLYYHHLEQVSQRPPLTASIAGTILLLCVLNYVLQYLNLVVLSPQDVLWHFIVYIIPTPLLLDRARKQQLGANDYFSRMHTAKGDALRRILGLGGSAILNKLPAAGEFVGLNGMGRKLSLVAGVRPTTSDVPAGLGNWDNSCYQNSVLQALSSLNSLTGWLKAAEPPHGAGATTNIALQETIGKLRNPNNNGRHIWTPAKLKNMSSWQQQDAQEYFSKIMDELDKEAKQAWAAGQQQPGLETILDGERKGDEKGNVEVKSLATSLRNPMEGLVAQRVVCTRCGFSEGFSMIPFNCLTVPLGSQFVYDIGECLDEYTKSEDIEGVECRSCTLIQVAERLQKLLANAPFEPDQMETSEALTASAGQTSALPPELRVQIARRLQAIQKAMDEDDFADKTLKQDCQISPKVYASTIKTREAIIGRAPQSLVVHINRSVFDEMTGVQRKNYARVRYPMILDLRPWTLQDGDTPVKYRLCAIVEHYGRHENGHYICYRKHHGVPPLTDDEPDTDGYQQIDDKERWWRLSDEEVSAATESEVLGQGGVFMLFYERSDEPAFIETTEDIDEAAAMPLPPDEARDWNDRQEVLTTEAPSLVPSATQSVVSGSDTEWDTEDQSERSLHPEEKALRPQTPMLKTASPPSMRHGMGMNRSLMSV